MKKKYFLLLFLLYIIHFEGFSQISMTVDSLIVDDVVWMSRNNVWIEGFAYGPHMRFVCSIRNNSDDTIMIDIKNGVSFEFGSLKRYHKRINVDQAYIDSILFIPSCSQVQIDGELYLFFLLDGEKTVGDNYTIVNFLPSITEMIKKSHVIIQLEHQTPLKAAIQNCFAGRNFFQDYTFNESIISGIRTVNTFSKEKKGKQKRN